MQHTKVKDIMTPNPETTSPEETLNKAAGKMKDKDCGVLPVSKDGKLHGIITDRDIVIRGLCSDKNPADARVEECMTQDVFSCKESDTLSDAAEIMRKHDVSRLIVTDENGKIAGILSFGSILRKNKDLNEVSDVVACATGHRKAA